MYFVFVCIFMVRAQKYLNEMNADTLTQTQYKALTTECIQIRERCEYMESNEITLSLTEIN